MTNIHLDGDRKESDQIADSAGFLLIACGVGITPIYSILLTAAQRQNDRL